MLCTSTLQPSIGAEQMAEAKQRILVALPVSTIEKLDELTSVNQRTRPNALEILIDNAHAEYVKNSATRINPAPTSEKPC